MTNFHDFNSTTKPRADSWEMKSKLEDATRILTQLRAALAYKLREEAEMEGERAELQDRINRMGEEMQRMEERAEREKVGGEGIYSVYIYINRGLAIFLLPPRLFLPLISYTLMKFN